MVASPQVSWLFSRRERSAHPAPFLPLPCMAIPQSAQKWSGTGRASNTEKQPTGSGPEGGVGNGSAAALLVGYVPHHVHPPSIWLSPRQHKNGAGCALQPPVRLGPPCRRPILTATTSPLYTRPYTSARELNVPVIPQCCGRAAGAQSALTEAPTKDSPRSSPATHLLFPERTSRRK
jgi:hypothetical protein